MLMSRVEIIEEIEEQIRKAGGDHSVWCVGIVEDPQDIPGAAPLAGDQDALVMYRQAYTSQAARAVRDYFVSQCGIGNEAGGEDRDGRFVYLCKKAPHIDRLTLTLLDPALMAHS